jgi:hypothetical protein
MYMSRDISLMLIPRVTQLVIGIHLTWYQSYVDPPKLSNWLLDLHVADFQSYVDPHVTQLVMVWTCHGIPVICWSPMLLNWLLYEHVTGYQSYVDPPCYPTVYCMNMSRDISHILIPHVTQLVIGWTCRGISVICWSPCYSTGY